MSIKFRMYQDNRKNSKRKGYWYARAVSPDLVSVKDLALRISERCTVTEPDILAVISALVFEMNQVLKDGNRVKLDGLFTHRVFRRRKTLTHREISTVRMCFSRQR